MATENSKHLLICFEKEILALIYQFLQQEINSCTTKSILSTRNRFLQQEINSCSKKSILAPRNQTLQQEMYSHKRKLLSFTGHTELVSIISIVSHSLWKNLFFEMPNFRAKARTFQQRFCVKTKDFVATRFPSLPLISHPGLYAT